MADGAAITACRAGHPPADIEREQVSASVWIYLPAEADLFLFFKQIKDQTGHCTGQNTGQNVQQELLHRRTSFVKNSENAPPSVYTVSFMSSIRKGDTPAAGTGKAAFTYSHLYCILHFAEYFCTFFFGANTYRCREAIYVTGKDA